MSWLASQMAKAEELLQSADKKAGQEIHKVKERAAELGINLTPAVGAPSEESASEQATVVVLSQAAAALLDAEERERILSSGTATIEADEVPATPAATSSTAATAADRAAEWSALQQELQILSMHGKRMHAKLKECAAQLQQARAAEAAARKQLEQSNDARSAAEQAAHAARGTVDEQMHQSDAVVAAAKAQAAAAERNATEHEAMAASAQEELALARQEVARHEEAAALQAAALAGLRLELNAEREQAAAASQAAASRIAAAEALNEDLQQRNQLLSSSMADGARAGPSSAKVAANAEAVETAKRLEAELSKARAEKGLAVEAERRAARDMDAMRADLEAARRQVEEASRGRAAAERALATAQHDAKVESDARAAAEMQQQQKSGGAAASTAAATGNQAAARSAAALLERDQRLEKLLSERTALKFQLEAESGRRAALEKQLATIGASVGGAAAAAGGGATRIDIAVEHAPLMSGRSRGGEGSVPSRQLTRLLQANVRNPRPQLVQAANAADDLLDLLDRTALTAGRHLRVHRALRLGAVGYLIMLHAWILILLLHMMPSVPEPVRATASVGTARPRDNRF